MVENPFSPVFGGKPDLFFGRERILQQFDQAMANRGSGSRALFITGSRGYGKTALLEQLSIRARHDGRKVIDVGPDNPIGNIMRHLVAYDESTKTLDPEVEVNVFGTGGRVHGGAVSRTVRYDNDDFSYLFLDICERENPKVFLSVDEIQKVAIDDVSIICNAFQMASRKGYDVMMAVAGLPFAHSKVIQHDGCTFLRRGDREELGPFSYDEVCNAFAAAFEKINGLDADNGAISCMAQLSKGHPYLVQLIGYYLVQAANDGQLVHARVVGEEDVERVAPWVLEVYGTHATRPLLEGLPRADVEYLHAMANVMNKERVTRTADIADALGKSLSQLSMVRDHLLSNGIVYAPAQGELVFAVPYLADYLLEHGERESGLSAVTAWKM